MSYGIKDLEKSGALYLYITTEERNLKEYIFTEVEMFNGEVGRKTYWFLE